MFQVIRSHMQIECRLVFVLLIDDELPAVECLEKLVEDDTVFLPGVATYVSSASRMAVSLPGLLLSLANTLTVATSNLPSNLCCKCEGQRSSLIDEQLRRLRRPVYLADQRHRTNPHAV